MATHGSLLNPDDAKTLQETTTRYDALGRSIASTVWMQPLGWWMFRLRRLLTLTVSPDTDGLKTLYDVDLTDGVGLEVTLAVLHRFAVLIAECQN